VELVSRDASKRQQQAFFDYLHARKDGIEQRFGSSRLAEMEEKASLIVYAKA
jgi:hypothetical protein